MKLLTVRLFGAWECRCRTLSLCFLSEVEDDSSNGRGPAAREAA